MARERNSGQIKITTKGSILKERNKGKENMCGVTAVVMTGTGSTIESTATGSTGGQTVEAIRVSYYEVDCRLLEG